MCYGDPSATKVPPCCETATTKLTFSTTSVLLLLNMPLSLSRATIFRRQKNPRRVYRPKIAGILFVCNEPEGKYYTVPKHFHHEKLDRKRRASSKYCTDELCKEFNRSSAKYYYPPCGGTSLVLCLLTFPPSRLYSLPPHLCGPGSLHHHFQYCLLSAVI